ncbi:MAG TPA: 4Fe-4S dicluster domain-containing protein [Ktedonobacterales bacterium]|jgi:formate dehydrogenase iron-sulfur subunit
MAKGFFTDTTLCIGCKACEVACKQWNQLPADDYILTGMSYDNTAQLGATTWRHVAFIEQFDGDGRYRYDQLDGAGAWGGAGAIAGAVRQTPAADGAALGDAPAGFLTGNRWLMMSDVCKHCEHAGCLNACPTGAIIRNEFGDVYVQPDICNGCGYCVPACPFGVIAINHDDGRAWKCTLCYDRQKAGMVPACAKACPTQSIQFGELSELRDRARDRVAQLHERGIGDAYLYGVDERTTVGALNAFFLLVQPPEVYNLPERPQLPQAKVLGAYAVAALTATLLGAATIATFLRGGRR